MSPCYMASKVYAPFAVDSTAFRQYDYCANPRCMASKRVSSAAGLQDLDTLYVQFYVLDDFVANVLPNIDVRIVLLSGGEMETDSDRKYIRGFTDAVAYSILENPSILHWFTQNPWLAHPKMDGFPAFGPSSGWVWTEHFFAQLERPSPFHERALIYAGPLGVDSRRSFRADIPRLNRTIPESEFFEALSRHQFVIRHMHSCTLHVHIYTLPIHPPTNQPTRPRTHARTQPGRRSSGHVPKHAGDWVGGNPSDHARRLHLAILRAFQNDIQHVHRKL